MDPIPTTPFATRLSGSAKELRLRIQNIVRGKKKRPPLVLAAPVLALTVLCGSLVAFVSPEEEVPPPPPPVVNIVDRAPDMPGPVQTVPDGPGPEPETDPVPEPEPEILPPPPVEEALAVLALPNGTAYVAVDPNSLTSIYLRPYNALYWQTLEETVCLHSGYYGNIFQLAAVHVLGLECLELTRYTLLEDGSVSDTPNSFGTDLYDLGQEDGVPSHLLYLQTTDISYEDFNDDGILDIMTRDEWVWYTRTPGGRIVRLDLREGRYEIPGVGWLTGQIETDGKVFQVVSGDTDVLYWLDGDVRKKLRAYPDDKLGDICPTITLFDGYMSWYTERPCVLGHRVICVTHTLGGRYMADFYAIDTPEPTFLLTIEDEATSFRDLDGDGVEELVFESRALWFHKRDMTPFVLVYSAGPDGRPRCADLSQLFPEWFQEEGTYIDNDGCLVQGSEEDRKVLLTGPEVMAAIDAANAWSDQIPTWQDIHDRTGTRGPAQ